MRDDPRAAALVWISEIHRGVVAGPKWIPQIQVAALRTRGSFQGGLQADPARSSLLARILN